MKNLFLQGMNNISIFFLNKILFLIILIIPFWSIAQVPMEKVLIEMGTATWNADCAQEVAIIEQMNGNGYQICVINYHLNDNFANQYSNQRATYYNMQNLPHPVVHGQDAVVADYNSYEELYNLAVNTPSSFSISATGSFLEDSLFLSIEVEKVAEFAENNLQLYVAVSETNISNNWFSLTQVDDVERAMSPDGLGQLLDFSEENLLIFNEKILFESHWDLNNMQLVVFVQNNENKEVLQCHSQSLANFAPFPVQAHFYVDDTLICAKEDLQFYNTSTGGIETSQWFFEEGGPEESNQFEPLIHYPNAGVFYVSLAVANSVSTDTLTIAQYVHVQELPQVDFLELPPFCRWGPPYELIEGNPQGGQYFGDFVNEGLFYPADAGIGAYNLFYTYMEEETQCADTATQIAYVDHCPGVEKITSPDFPLQIKVQNKYLHFKENNTNHLDILAVAVYDLKASLLFKKHYDPTENINEKFLFPENNPLLIFHVYTENNKYVAKFKTR
ncbi:MAG: hypothetical protein B7C24_10795 [Bacteroidetes bacterium 4572_77]|nr:MAG: hypothetical protein B7C24_10795 [Bacteroidetes bacterium 4572_77]